MTSQEQAFHDFAAFAAKLKGDEKSEAQTFLFHLLEAFGHDANTLPEGSTFEYRVRFPGDRTKFADFVWPGRVLIEMKSRGEKLSRHYQQTFDYWLNLVPHRPPYVVLCDFTELWIYDFNTQLQEPLDRVPVAELVNRHSALNFLYPRKITPIFGNNWLEVTREAAKDVANVFNSLVARGESREAARRFVLQCVVAMFSEDIGLLPEDMFTGILDECRKAENPVAASYDLIGNLFRQMNDPKPARGGRFAGVDYFNGGLFAKIEPLELQPAAIGLLFEAAKENWSKVQPVIFGRLFEGSLGKEERHALGAHFTYEADIQKIVRPTIVRPWEERIAAAKNVAEMLELLRQLRTFRVLDPACGSGNFLFVAYRALRELEQNLLVKLFAQDKRQFEKVGTTSGISPRQFFGLDVNNDAVETAKVTLMLARRLASRQAHEFWDTHADVLPGGDSHALQFEKDLPLDNLDDNIKCADALFTPWPEVDAIIGNPPFQSKNKMQQEFGPAYVQKLRKAYPAIPGRADFCVYWFRRAHDHLKPGQRAGLVGTNTIRQNYSREGGLDYIVNMADASLRLRKLRHEIMRDNPVSKKRDQRFATKLPPTPKGSVGLRMLTGAISIAALFSGLDGKWREWWVELLLVPTAFVACSLVIFDLCRVQKSLSSFRSVLFSGGFLLIVGGLATLIYIDTSVPKWQPPELPRECQAVFIKLGTTTLSYSIKNHKLIPLPIPIEVDGTIPVEPYIKNNRMYVKTQTVLEGRPTLLNISEESSKSLPLDWDANYSTNAYEIVNAERSPVFQVFYQRPYEVVIKGIVATSNDIFLIGDGEFVIRTLPLRSKAILPNPTPIFKYPSWQHRGEFAN